MTFQHYPVLLKEVLSAASVREGFLVFDGTLGGGGYTKAFLDKGAKVIACDLDDAALQFSTEWGADFLADGSLKVVKGNFKDIASISAESDIEGFDVIVVDIGISSFQLDSAFRGFSFNGEEPLDMRFDQTEENSAADFLNETSVQAIASVLREYGEERFATQIAKQIEILRPLRTNKDLVDAIKAALPKSLQHKWTDSARRVFQAVRIFVNDELTNLKVFLPSAFELLKPGGRLVIVSFHSLEDRIVKEFFVGLTKSCICPPLSPICICGKKALAEFVVKGAVMAGEDELNVNSRSRSARLRAVKKI